MKPIFSILLFTLLTQVTLFSQSPEMFNYQAVVRNSDGEILSNQEVDLKFEIIQGSINGSVVYSETHNTSTSDHGLVVLHIGNGNPESGDISLINWGAHSHYLQIGIDDAGDGNFQTMGVSQLLSVPYALHSRSTDNVEDDDADPQNEIQKIKVDSLDISPIWFNNQIYLDSLSLVLSETMDTILLYDSNPLNEFQAIRVVDTTASTASDTGFAFVNLDPALSSSAVLDASPNNEIQIMSKTTRVDFGGKYTILELVNDNSTIASRVIIEDTDYTNELQRFRPVQIGLNFYIIIEEKQNDGDNGFEWVASDTICIPDSDELNEIQTFNNVINDLSCSNEYELQIGHTETDSAGNVVWVLDDSIILPDTDKVNELQRLEIQDGISSSLLKILKKECINDSLAPGLQRTVWVTFDSVWINDTSPVNELQSLSYNPATEELTITGGNSVDITRSNIGPWLERSDMAIVDYDGTAKAHTFCTPMGGVLIDDTGISRYDPASGDKVSNICLEKVGNDVWGKFEVLKDEALAAVFQSCTHGSGILDFFGPNGNFNIVTGHMDGFPNHGLVGVVNSGNIMNAVMFIDDNGTGVLFADVKNFKMDHPKEFDKEIWYASLEGPEVAAYERGTAQLEKGTIFIPFSEHFKEVINPNDMTVMLTPLSADTYGLAVVEKSKDGFRVKELMNGTGNFQFDWEVKSKRKNHENFEPVRQKSELNFVNTHLDH